jgi:predicted short-subunit dehydrogenase-like oxidoreductase (DUF2520 family)
MTNIKVVSIGSGDLAHHFIPAFHKAGCDILQVYSRNLSNAEKLSIKVKATATDSLGQLNTEAEVYLLMVKDDAIKEVVAQLPQLNSKQILAHSSGATSIILLGKKAENYGSFYALQSFKKNKPADLSEIPFFIFGNTPLATRVLRMMARQLSPTVQEVDDKSRLRYHLAAVIMNNFTNHLACKTSQFLEDNHLDPKVLLPIVKSSFDKILNSDPCLIQTGPARRNDVKVEAKHLALIKEDAYLSAIYKSLTQSIKKTYNTENDAHS